MHRCLPPLHVTEGACQQTLSLVFDGPALTSSQNQALFWPATQVTCHNHPAAQRVFRQGGLFPSGCLLKTTQSTITVSEVHYHPPPHLPPRKIAKVRHHPRDIFLFTRRDNILPGFCASRSLLPRFRLTDIPALGLQTR